MNRINDVISRHAAVEAIENTDWYHLMDGVMVRGANSKEHQAWYKEQDIYKALEQLPSAQQRWIPCSERLPEPNRHDALNVDVYYLAQTEFGDMIVASYNESHEGTKWWEQMYSYRIFDDEIVAWMPLPDPYKEVQE